MSNVFEDMENFHHYFGIKEVVSHLDPEMKAKLLDFRVSMILEEIYELTEAMDENDSEGVVDALIDLLVFTVGTLDLYDVNGEKAWNEVMKANFKKKVGVKEGRENPYGLPDLVKPEGWEEPTHLDNLGTLVNLQLADVDHNV